MGSTSSNSTLTVILALCLSGLCGACCISAEMENRCSLPSLTSLLTSPLTVVFFYVLICYAFSAIVVIIGSYSISFSSLMMTTSGVSLMIIDKIINCILLVSDHNYYSYRKANEHRFGVKLTSCPHESDGMLCK